MRRRRVNPKAASELEDDVEKQDLLEALVMVSDAIPYLRPDNRAAVEALRAEIARRERMAPLH